MTQTALWLFSILMQKEHSPSLRKRTKEEGNEFLAKNKGERMSGRQHLAFNTRLTALAQVSTATAQDTVLVHYKKVRFSMVKSLTRLTIVASRNSL